MGGVGFHLVKNQIFCKIWTENIRFIALIMGGTRLHQQHCCTKEKSLTRLYPARWVGGLCQLYVVLATQQSYLTLPYVKEACD